MNPSSQSPRPDRAVLCQRAGELADFASLLEELGIPVEVCSGELPQPEQLEGARLVVVTGQRLTEARLPAVERWPRTIAVLDDGSRTLSTHLARIGIATVVRRPVHPRALRLLLLHALYRGPERRVKKRIVIGQPVRTGGGLFKQSATLLELSRSGARLELANPPRVGSLIQFSLGKELTGAKPIQVYAKVVRSIGAKSANRNEGQVGVALIDPTGELARPIQAILDRFGAGGPIGAKSGGDASARGGARPQTSSRPAPIRTTPASKGIVPSTPIAPMTPTSPTPPRPSKTAPILAPAPGSARSAMEPVKAERKLPPSYVEASPAPASDAIPTGVVSEPPSPRGEPECAPTRFDTEIELLDFELDDVVETDGDLELEVDDEGAGANDQEARPRDEDSDTDRRRATRVDYTRRVVALDEQAARVVVGRDLGYGGMRIDPNSELRLGDVVKLALHAGADSAPLVVLAGVERDDGENGLVLAFADLTPGQRDRLEKIIATASAFTRLERADGAPNDATNQALVVGEVVQHMTRGA